MQWYGAENATDLRTLTSVTLKNTSGYRYPSLPELEENAIKKLKSVLTSQQCTTTTTVNPPPTQLKAPPMKETSSKHYCHNFSKETFTTFLTKEDKGIVGFRKFHRVQEANDRVQEVIAKTESCLWKLTITVVTCNITLSPS